ncbi:MAG TPA: hypothetical protein VFK85_05220 [Anaeromyxobacteraceae bacterium]|nr:hypothetical protein [Anaeromyxobacteraceae bacterium]
MTRLPALALAAALLLPGCRKSGPPDATYRAFAQATREGDAETAWGLLSQRTREWLDGRAKQIAAQAPAGVVQPSGKALLLGDAALAAPRVKSVVVVRESADRAVLQVDAEGQPPREVTLVNERGWRVDIPPPGP